MTELTEADEEFLNSLNKLEDEQDKNIILAYIKNNYSPKRPTVQFKLTHHPLSVQGGAERLHKAYRKSIVEQSEGHLAKAFFTLRVAVVRFFKGQPPQAADVKK